MKHIENCKILVPKNFPDCTGQGVSFRHDRVTVILDAPYIYTEHLGHRYYDRPDEVAVRKYCHKKKLDESKVLILCDKFDNPVYSPYCKPLDAIWGVKDGEKLVGPCAGGNYVLVDIENADGCREERIFRIHDRYDTQKNWDGLSI